MSEKYLELVKSEARKLGKIFLIDSGEGKEWLSPDGEWYAEELTGWLLDDSDVHVYKALVAQQGKEAVYRRFTGQYYLVHWELVSSPQPGDSPVTVSFERLQSFPSYPTDVQ